MRRYLPEEIDNGARRLDDQGRNDDTDDFVVDIHTVEQPDTHQIAGDADGVWHDAMALLAQLLQVPATCQTVEKNEHRGNENGEQVDGGEEQQLVFRRQSAQKRKCKQHGDTHQRQVEGCEEQTDHSGHHNESFVTCHVFLRRATGSPSCSRYLATVRRAMGNPCRCSSSRSASSLMGFCLSSFSISCFNAALI